MLLADREQFNAQLGALCAGFNVPMTELRSDAYWRGLERMNLSQFARVVTHALGEEGPERIPTASQIWSLWRQIRNKRPPASPPVSDGAANAKYDAYHGFAQRCLLVWLAQNGPVTDDVLARLIAEKSRLLEQYRMIAAEFEVTADEMREHLMPAFRRVAA